MCQKTTIEELMNIPDITVNPNDKVIKAGLLILTNDTRYIKVEDESGRYLGVLRLKKLSKFLIDALLKDALTGCYNRAFLKIIEDDLKVGKHVFAFIDLNDFKNINDTYGHLYGDEILQMFVNIF